MAQYSRIPLDEDTVISLADKYARASFVAKNSLMEAFLNPGTYKSENGKVCVPIFPFGCNRSQYKAVRDALSNRLSIIQGPPGTGKTQTILNVMANLLMAGKTIQIVSNNNSAVDNVAEKLSSVGLDFILARLGKAKNKEEFVNSQTGCYPDFNVWEPPSEIPSLGEVQRLSEELQILRMSFSLLPTALRF